MIMLPDASEMVEKWNIPISFPSAMFRTRLPSIPRILAEAWMVVPDGTRIISPFL